MFQEGSNEFPKVSAVVSSEPVSASKSLAMLIDFLAAEQQKLGRHPQLESSNHWEDIFLVSETLAHSEKERAKLQDLRGIATLNSSGDVPPTDDLEQAERVVKTPLPHGKPTSPPEGKNSPEKEEQRSLGKAERKAAKSAEKDEKKKRKEAKKERKETKKQKR
jgi:hypothetical protein